MWSQVTTLWDKDRIVKWTWSPSTWWGSRSCPWWRRRRGWGPERRTWWRRKWRKDTLQRIRIHPPFQHHQNTDHRLPPHCKYIKGTARVISSERWQCPIHNDTLKSFVWSSLKINVYNFAKLIISQQKWLAHFYYRKIYKKYQNQILLHL